MFRVALSVFLLFMFSLPMIAQNKSAYTSLTKENCQVKIDPKLPIMSGLCLGVKGYDLQIADDDSRMSVNVVAPNQKVFELDFWGYFRNFSSIGEKAEWRMKRDIPIALIIRYFVSDKGDENPPTQYLMVAKISPQTACVTDIVKPSKNQKLVAQKLADNAAKKPCKKVE